MTSLLVPHAGSSAAVVRRTLLRELRQQGVPEEAVDDALLVVSELVGNAVRHGRPLAGQGIRVSWWVTGGAVHVEVCDGGPGLPGDAGELRPGPLDTAEGGRGLPIVDLLSARWGTTGPGPDRPFAVHAELPLATHWGSRTSRGAQRGRPFEVQESASA